MVVSAIQAQAPAPVTPPGGAGWSHGGSGANNIVSSGGASTVTLTPTNLNSTTYSPGLNSQISSLGQISASQLATYRSQGIQPGSVLAYMLGLGNGTNPNGSSYTTISGNDGLTYYLNNGVWTTTAPGSGSSTSQYTVQQFEQADGNLPYSEFLKLSSTDQQTLLTYFSSLNAGSSNGNPLNLGGAVYPGSLAAFMLGLGTNPSAGQLTALGLTQTTDSNGNIYYARATGNATGAAIGSQKLLNTTSQQLTALAGYYQQNPSQIPTTVDPDSAAAEVLGLGNGTGANGSYTTITANTGTVYNLVNGQWVAQGSSSTNTAGLVTLTPTNLNSTTYSPGLNSQISSLGQISASQLATYRSQGIQPGSVLAYMLGLGNGTNPNGSSYTTISGNDGLTYYLNNGVWTTTAPGSGSSTSQYTVQQFEQADGNLPYSEFLKLSSTDQQTLLTYFSSLNAGSSNGNPLNLGGAVYPGSLAAFMLGLGTNPSAGQLTALGLTQTTDSNGNIYYARATGNATGAAIGSQKLLNTTSQQLTALAGYYQQNPSQIPTTVDPDSAAAEVLGLGNGTGANGSYTTITANTGTVYNLVNGQWVAQGSSSTNTAGLVKNADGSITVTVVGSDGKTYTITATSSSNFSSQMESYGQGSVAYNAFYQAYSNQVVPFYNGQSALAASGYSTVQEYVAAFNQKYPGSQTPPSAADLAQYQEITGQAWAPVNYSFTFYSGAAITLPSGDSFANSPQWYASYATASQIAQAYGGTVVVIPIVGAAAPMYGIVLPGDTTAYNAGQLAENIIKYGYTTAAQMLQQEVASNPDPTNPLSASEYMPATGNFNTDVKALPSTAVTSIYQGVTVNTNASTITNPSNLINVGTQYPAGYGGTGTGANAGGSTNGGYTATTSYGTLSFTTGSGNTSLVSVGDTWQISITGAAANTPVYVVGGLNGAQIKTQMGTTDQNGTLILNGTFTTSNIGAWNETWMVGTHTIGSFSFTVQAATAGSNSGTGSGASTGTGSGASTTVTAPTLVSLSATDAPAGTIITATGSNFAAVASNNIVEFYNSAGALVANVPASAVSGNNLQFVVPQNVSPGAYTINVMNLNAYLAVSNGLSFTVDPTTAGSGNASQTSTTVALAPATVGVAYNQTLTWGTNTGVNWNLTSGTLPPGLALASGSGTISGTPTTAGQYIFTIQAVSGTATATQTFSITVSPAASGSVASSVVTTLTLSENTSNVTVGGTDIAAAAVNIATTVNGSTTYAGGAVTAVSANSAIATVSVGSGNILTITGIGAGVTTITVHPANLDSSNTSQDQFITVTVTAPGGSSTGGGTTGTSGTTDPDAALIASLANQIDQLQNQVNYLSTQLGNNSGNNYEYANAQIAALTSQINQLQNTINSLRAPQTITTQSESVQPAGFVGLQMPVTYTAPVSQDVLGATTGTTYTVKKGDTLWGIAQKYYGDGTQWRKILAANSNLVKNPRTMRVGITLVIPNINN